MDEHSIRELLVTLKYFAPGSYLKLIGKILIHGREKNTSLKLLVQYFLNRDSELGKTFNGFIEMMVNEI